ncbi:MAG: gliding motility-associated C-terminal domain-containing protein [Elusimicrobia bacterium]|nr:gliding motility-associated C-terminal domain-containing protein [Elusimicrobiota bacterium]
MKIKESVQSAEFKVQSKTLKTWLIVLLTLLLSYSLPLCLYAVGFKLIEVKPGIITPNGDNRNDRLIVIYENPNDSNVSGRIITISGHYVADMLVDPDINNPKITWDGKYDSGDAVPSGIYIYQIEVEGEVINGTVVVAK